MNNKQLLGTCMGVAFTLYAAGTIASHVPDTYLPPVPCDHVMMQSAVMDDGSAIAMCGGSDFYSFDPDDQAWGEMVVIQIRGAGLVPIDKEHALSLQRHAELIGDQRAVGVYE